MGVVVGYRGRLLSTTNAIAIFKLSATEHPWSSNAFDSLGEAHAKSGERDLAIKSYAMAVILDPTNGRAAGALKELGLARALWLAFPAISAISGMFVAAILIKRRRTRPQIGRLPLDEHGSGATEDAPTSVLPIAAKRPAGQELLPCGGALLSRHWPPFER